MDNTLVQKQEYWKSLMDSDFEQFITEISNELPVEVSEFLLTLPIETILHVLTKLKNNQLVADIFSEFDTQIQNKIYSSMLIRDFARIFNMITSESRIVFYRQLDSYEQSRLLPYLSKSVRENIIMLRKYDENTAGGIMSTDFATVLDTMTVKQAMDKIKQDAPSKKMIFYIYVVDNDMKLLGFISIKDLILADQNQSINDYINSNFVYAYVNEDQEAICSKIEKYSLIAIPILNDENQLVGIVKYDDAIEVIRDEQTEDMEKLMGIVSTGNDDATYLQLSSFKHYSKRIGWIIGLFLLGTLTSMVMQRYEIMLSTVPMLALYIPMITSTGGNIGSQSASVVIRALSMNEITWKDFLLVIVKELKVGLMTAVTLFTLTLSKAMFFNPIDSTNSEAECRIIALTVSTSLGVQIMTSIIIGTILPMIAKYFEMDPAVVASPAITTMVDITGIIIYFSIAYYFLGNITTILN